MRRAIVGLLVTALLLPLVTLGIVCRLASRSRSVQAVIILATISALSGCAAILEHDARSCHRQAYTVAAMLECNQQYPQHNGTISDRIAQPLGELERVLNKP